MKLYPFFLVKISLLLLSAIASGQQTVPQWKRYEVILRHSYKGNAFQEVSLKAKFTHKDTVFIVDGFYDGDDKFCVRFMPELTGIWEYVTVSNISQLNNQKGSFECIKATENDHGIVRVNDTYNFKYADGKQYYPVGTTAYAWIHMGKKLQQLTLQTLKSSGFNKVRMCVFPKDYNLVKEEPEIFPFIQKGLEKNKEGKEKKTWDFNQFNPEFFRTLETQIDELNKLGIQADLILFHPYDKGRWGFDSLSMDVNISYLKYIISRLSSFSNVWWSIANEYDYVKYKSHDDWLNLTHSVYKADPYRHLLSIHGSSGKYFEYWLPEFTHVSIQDEGPVLNWGAAVLLRNAYYKPIIYDEVGYEGNLASRWGRYSAQEMTYAMWMGIIGGTYVTHGESYLFRDARDTIFWAKGGEFKGTSWKRAAFLRKILESGPGPLEQSDAGRDFKTATAGDGYYLVYFGKEINDSWLFNLPQKNAGYSKLISGKKFKVEVIDTWEMTISEVKEIFETSAVTDYRMLDKDLKKVRLPLKPYLALRIMEIKN